MNLSDYQITKIDSVKLYGHKRLEKNIPDEKEVSKKEFDAFLSLHNFNEKIIVGYTDPGYTNYYDTYGNIVACKLFYNPIKYYINPELYEKGKREHKKIEDVWSEELYELADLKDCTPTTISETIKL